MHHSRLLLNYLNDRKCSLTSATPFQASQFRKSPRMLSYWSWGLSPIHSAILMPFYFCSRKFSSSLSTITTDSRGRPRRERSLMCLCFSRVVWQRQRRCAMWGSCAMISSAYSGMEEVKTTSSQCLAMTWRNSLRKGLMNISSLSLWRCEWMSVSSRSSTKVYRFEAGLVRQGEGQVAKVLSDWQCFSSSPSWLLMQTANSRSSQQKARLMVTFLFQNQAASTFICLNRAALALSRGESFLLTKKTVVYSSRLMWMLCSLVLPWKEQRHDCAQSGSGCLDWLRRQTRQRYVPSRECRMMLMWGWWRAMARLASRSMQEMMSMRQQNTKVRSSFCCFSSLKMRSR